MTSRRANTEDQLRDALDALASGVRPAPNAYGRVRHAWRRRERRRRLILAILVTLVFAIADAIGLLALNQSQDGPPVIFNDPTPVEQQHHP